MPAPVASQTRSPFSASKETRACPRAARARRGQDRAELAAVERGGVRLIIQPEPADVHGRGVLEALFPGRVLAGPGDGAQPPGDGDAGTAVGLQVAREGLDAGTADREQDSERTRHQARQEPGERESSGLGQYRLDGDEGGSGVVAVIGHPPERLKTRKARASRPAPATNDELQRKPHSLATPDNGACMKPVSRPNREARHTADSALPSGW